MSETITSRPFAPKMACERCVFGRGEHAEWCDRNPFNRMPLVPVKGGLFASEEFAQRQQSDDARTLLERLGYPSAIWPH
jgi:hypothetical protein